MFYDVFAFIVLACAIFFTSLSKRSLLFNVIISLSMLIKISLGGFFYRRNTSRSLRLYFMFRYIYNLMVIYPLVIIFKIFSATYLISYFVAGGVLLFLELIITAIYCRHLCLKTSFENFEDIPGYKVVNQKAQSMVIHLHTKDSADYIIKDMG